MKTKYLALIIALTSTLYSHGQLAHWDFKDGDQSPLTWSAEANPHDCITALDIVDVGLDYSVNTNDSEDNSLFGANCFVGWGDAGPNYISFKVTADANAFGSIDQFNFDIANYAAASDPTQYRITAFKNGAQFSQSGWLAINGVAQSGNGGPWTGTPDENHFYTGLTATAGVIDTFEFRIEANQSNGRIALDNVRVFGDITCVPEPSTSLLGALALGSAGLIRRRK